VPGPGELVVIQLEWDGDLNLHQRELGVERAVWSARWWRVRLAAIEDEEDEALLVEVAEFADVRDAVAWSRQRATEVEVVASSLGALLLKAARNFPSSISNTLRSRFLHVKHPTGYRGVARATERSQTRGCRARRPIPS
jgi:hypothetical protein